MYLLPTYLILGATLLSGLTGFLVGARLVSYFLTFTLLVSLVINTFCFYNIIILRNIVHIKVFTWLDLEALQIDFGLYFDSLSVFMCEIVLLISFLVHLYSIDYMRGDPHRIRFFFYLSLFTWCMLIMVLSDSMVQFFVAWEGVGLMSYLLIGFWFTRAEAARSAFKALVVNKIGDIALYGATLMIFVNVNLVSFSEFNSLIPLNLEGRFYSWELIMALFLVAAFGKSAQLGMHTWLPDAMEGPTPVSALLHAATMVTAGVYLLLRISPILSLFPTCLTVCAVVGALTALFSAIIGCLQNDIKKIIAYSTCSQLGYMFMAVGTTNFVGAFFHLVNHAFFKALLFLGAGVLIHVFNNQDLRRMGRVGTKNSNINYEYRFLILLILIGNMSLVGLIFLSGAYSKDYILEFAFVSGHSFCRFVGLLTAGLTTFYSVRLVYKSFVTIPTRASRRLTTNVSPISITWATWIPLMILGLLSMFSGYWLKDLFIGLGSDTFSDILPTSPERWEQNVEYLSVVKKLTPMLLISVVCVLTWLGYNYSPFKNFEFLTLYLNNIVVIKSILTFVVKEQCGFNRIYYSCFNFLMRMNHTLLFKEIERGLLESLTYYWILRILRYGEIKIKQSQVGTILSYIFLVGSTTVFGLVLIMFFRDGGVVLGYTVFLFCGLFFSKIFNLKSRVTDFLNYWGKPLLLYLVRFMENLYKSLLNLFRKKEKDAKSPPSN